MLMHKNHEYNQKTNKKKKKKGTSIIQNSSDQVGDHPSPLFFCRLTEG